METKVAVRKIPEIWTTEKEISDFLDETGDVNKWHRLPHNVLPGMYFLRLVEKMIYYACNEGEGINRPIGAVEAEFTADFANKVRYNKPPLGLWARIIEDENSAKFEFLRKGKRVAKCALNYNDNLGTETKNSDKLWLAYLIPGKLQIQYGSSGIYLEQTLSFNGVSRSDTLVFGNITEKDKAMEVVTEYKNPCHPENGVTASGIAKVIPFRK